MVERADRIHRKIKVKATPVDIQEFLNLLQETPLRIDKMTCGIEESCLQARVNKDEWSVNDILAHLRSCADVWGDSIEKMLLNDKQTQPYLHPRQWIKKTDYPKLPFRESFRAFKTQRRTLLKELKNISFEDWERSATIKGRKHTIFTQVRRMAKHENVHSQQIEELLK